MEPTQPLFAEEPNAEVKDSAGKLEKPKAPPRVRMPDRKQMELRASGMSSAYKSRHDGTSVPRLCIPAYDRNSHNL